MSKNLTFKHRFDHFRAGEETVTASLDYDYSIDDYKHYIIVEPIDIPVTSMTRPRLYVPTYTYLVGPIVDRLHAFEEIGLEPEELKALVRYYRKRDLKRPEV